MKKGLSERERNHEKGADSSGQDLQMLYISAVEDAAFAEAEEIMPLGYLCTWHNYPESYPMGETVTLDWGNVWTFTPDELAQKYKAESSLPAWPYQWRDENPA